MTDVDVVVANIKNLKIQGATNVALALLDALEKTIAESPTVSAEELMNIGKRLAYARPTEPLAQNALRYIFEGNSEIQSIKEKIGGYRTFMSEGKKEMTIHGSSLITADATYLTHCHASTVTNIFLKNKEKRIKVIATETRPLMQGRITVKELLDGGLTDVTMIIDSAAAAVLTDPSQKISAVFIGADLLTKQGLVNKIGSLAIVFAAQAPRIPVYCISTLLKFDPRPFSTDLIEKRSPNEIWTDAPHGLSIYAPAFDFVPFTTGIKIVCEAGIVEGNALVNHVKKWYPFITRVSR